MNGRPRILDLFCGAGGAAMGYHQAGFEVVGVDIKPQPRYPFQFLLDEAIDFLRELVVEFEGPYPPKIDAIHASPPCQAFTVYGNNKGHVKQDHPDLVAETRKLLRATGLPYIIENVPGAPLENHVQVCGTWYEGLEVRRHRWFEANWPIQGTPCDHGRLTERKYPGSSNRPNGRTVCNVGEWRVPLDVQKKAMGVGWDVTMPELSQMVPPAYTRFLGKQLLDHLAFEAAKAVRAYGDL